MLIAAYIETVYKDHTYDIILSSNSQRLSNVQILGKLYWNLKVDDPVAITYFENDLSSPIIIDKIIMPTDELNSKSEIDDIHLKQIIETENDAGEKEIKGQIELHTDENGNLSLLLKGQQGNLNIDLSGDEDNSGQFTINSKGKTTINTEGDAEINAKGNVSVVSGGDASVKAKGKIIADSGDSVVITAAKTIELGNNIKKVLINNLPVCVVTGAKHSIGNIQVEV